MSTRFEEFETNKQKIRRRATSKGLSFGPLATAITVGAVALLLGVTFIGDWLRMPKVAAEASPTIISPNGDKAQTLTNFNYTLNEDAEVTIRVFNESGSLIQTLMSNQFQTRGQHLAVWDGQNNLGQVAPDGRYRLEVTARGTVRSGSQSATVVVDSVPPTLRLANLDELSRVREANLTVEGLTDADAVVQVEGDPTVIPVDAEGRFTLKQQLLEGSNVIQVTATDPAGNVATVAREVILVTKPPEVVIDNPVNGYWTNENLLNITGVVPAGASLKVNGQEATVNEDGTFEREVILQEGDNIVSVAATDDVGNVSSKDIIIHRKTTPPDLSVNVEEGQIFQQEEVQIIGKTNPGATVLVGGQKVDVSSLGEFQATVRLLQGDNLLGVVTQDQAGNTTRLQRRLRFNIPVPESELARVARNLPDLSAYFVPVLISLPVLLLLAYILTRPVALVISAESSAFQPGLPEEGRFLRLALDLSKAARTTVEIRDKRENTIATLLHRRHRSSGQHTLYWDGYDDFGRVVPPGEYTVYAAASATSGSVTGNLNISIVPDRTAHRQYLRAAPHQDDTSSLSRRSGEAIRTGASQIMRRRS